MGSMVEEEEPEGRNLAVVEALSAVLGEISTMQECRGPFHRAYYDLARRMKLLSRALCDLLAALVVAKDLLRWVNDGTFHKERSHRMKVGSSYKDEQARVLHAALSHVPRLRWSDSALILVPRDIDVSPSIVGSFARKSQGGSARRGKAKDFVD